MYKNLFFFLICLSLFGVGVIFFLLGSKKSKLNELRLNTGMSEVSQDKDEIHYVEFMTIPVGAEVYVDNVFLGRAPIRIPLKNKLQNLRVENKGYELYERELPSAESTKEDLRWKVSLMKKADYKIEAEKRAEKLKLENEKSEKAAKAAALPLKKEVKEKSLEPLEKISKLPFKSGRQKGFFLQLKSLPGADEDYAELMSYTKMNNFFGCRVEIKNRGEWKRFLVGPFPSKDSLNSFQSKNKKQLPSDAFVVKDQECI